MSIIIDKVSYTYDIRSKEKKYAVKDIKLVLPEGEFIGIIGQTGSGKSTLVQLLNGLIKATSGAIYYNGEDIYDPNYSLKELRKKVGLVFQYPDYQLFGATVFEDVCYGPENMGLSKLEIQKRAFDALKKVGFDSDIYDASPFELSGGQKKRVAIAGILAMEPEYLILDEPSAGLDPKGREQILALVKQLQQNENISIIMVSHSMEEVAQYADRLIVMDQGQVQMFDTPNQVFSRVEELEAMGLAVPETVYLAKELKKKGILEDDNIFTTKQAVESIYEALAKQM